MVAYSLLCQGESAAALRKLRGNDRYTDVRYLRAAENILEGLLPLIGDGVVTGSLAECVDFGNHPQNYGHNAWGQGAVLAAFARYASLAE